MPDWLPVRFLLPSFLVNYFHNSKHANATYYNNPYRLLVSSFDTRLGRTRTPFNLCNARGTKRITINYSILNSVHMYTVISCYIFATKSKQKEMVRGNLCKLRAFTATNGGVIYELTNYALCNIFWCFFPTQYPARSFG